MFVTLLKISSHFMSNLYRGLGKFTYCFLAAVHLLHNLLNFQKENQINPTIL